MNVLLIIVNGNTVYTEIKYKNNDSITPKGYGFFGINPFGNYS